MTKVYVITSGEYSDYSIDRVFLDKEKAEKFCEIGNREKRYGCDLEVEEWDVTDEVPGRVTWWRTTYERYTDAINEPWPVTYWDDQMPEYLKAQEDPYVQYDSGFRHLVVQSKDRERAIKVLSDKVAEIRARAEGIA